MIEWVENGEAKNDSPPETWKKKVLRFIVLVFAIMSLAYVPTKGHY